MGVFTAAVIAAVTERASGYCEACGYPLGSQPPAHHHRKLRRYGDHSAANVLVVHHRCHNLHQGSIHQNPDRSHRLGHMLHGNEDPASVPAIAVRNLLELRA
jgi:hypothetical protein